MAGSAGSAARRTSNKKRSPSFVSSLRQVNGGRSAEIRDYYDYNLVAAVVLLTCFGLVMLYSTSAYEAAADSGSDMAYFGKQAIISVISFGMMLFASMYVDYHMLAEASPMLYTVSLALLVITKFIGIEVNGARRWLGVGSLSFQPAELAKLAVILYLSHMIVHMSDRKRGSRRAVWTIFGFGGLAGFCAYVFTDNLSTGLILCGIAFVMGFIVSRDWKWFVGAVTGGIGLVVLMRLLVFPLISETSTNFRLRRILIWLDPTKYADGYGYQITQALYALGSGGLFGKGLGNSTQKLGALPEAQNDMIFSIICEELGVFGAAIVILLFVFLLYRLFFIAQNAPDLLGSLIAAGVFTHIAIQVVLNIAVVTNFIPTTGITLPFVSYGGTSVLFLMAEMAVVLNISHQITFK